MGKHQLQLNHLTKNLFIFEVTVALTKNSVVCPLPHYMTSIIDLQFDSNQILTELFKNMREMPFQLNSKLSGLEMLIWFVSS